MKHSKPKHTPGPWKVENHTEHTGPYASQRLEIWSNNRHIGQVNEHVDDLSIDEANAALIAAAPEMLAALERILIEIPYVNGKVDKTMKVTHSQIALDAINAAIQKAKGETV